MTLNEKQRQQLKMAQKRRERRPEPRTVMNELPLKLKRAVLDRFTSRCAHLLLAVELALQAACAEDSSLDDQLLMQALGCAIRDRQPASEQLSCVLVKLAIAAEESGGVADDWKTALQAVYTSAEIHYDGHANSRNYIRYAASFLARRSSLGKLS